MSPTIASVLDKSRGGRRLSPDDGLRLLESHNLAALAGAADALTRRLHPERFRTYNVDRNVNYTEHLHQPLPLLRVRAIARASPTATSSAARNFFRKIEETVALGGDQILLARRPAPGAGPGLVRAIAPRHQGAFSAAERPRLQPAGNRPYRRSLQAAGARRCWSGCKAAGLGSLPGGGAEILVDRVRQTVSPCKASADQWLEVCRAWHELGGRGSATMMFGHVETPGRTDRTPGATPPLAGRDGRLYRLHLLDLSARAHRPGRICPSAARWSTSRRWPSAGCIWTISPTSRRVG